MAQLERESIDSSGIQVLINGNWPQLQKLALDHTSLDHEDSAAALGFTQADLTKLLDSWIYPMTVRRNNVSHNLWPNLARVTVELDSSCRNEYDQVSLG